MSASQSRPCEQGGPKHNGQAREDESRLKEQLQRIRHKLLVMSGKGVNLIFAGGMGQRPWSKDTFPGPWLAAPTCATIEQLSPTGW